MRLAVMAVATIMMEKRPYVVTIGLKIKISPTIKCQFFYIKNRYLTDKKGVEFNNSIFSQNTLWDFQSAEF